MVQLKASIKETKASIEEKKLEITKTTKLLEEAEKEKKEAKSGKERETILSIIAAKEKGLTADKEGLTAEKKGLNILLEQQTALKSFFSSFLLFSPSLFSLPLMLLFFKKNQMTSGTLKNKSVFFLFSSLSFFFLLSFHFSDGSF